MKKIYCLLGSFLLSFSTSIAQETHLRNSKWFTYGKIVDFGYLDPNSMPQISDDTSYNNGATAVANVCDFDGSPLIVVYQNGRVWAKGQFLGMVPSTNNVIILPKPNHPNRYYLVFSDTGSGLSYTEVDLKNMALINQNTPLNDANGQPVLSSPGGSGVASTTHVNGTDYWITAFANDTLMSYLVTENGISTNPSSSTNLPQSDPDTTFKVRISAETNYNEKHIAIVNYYTGVLLKNFNDETGEITENYSAMNTGLNNFNSWMYGNLIKDTEFSSDGNTLYCVDYYGEIYDIQQDGTFSTFDYNGGYIASQLGPDGNLYFLWGDGELARLHPNANYLEYIGIDVITSTSQFQQWGHLPQLTSINQCLASPTIPTFAPTYICKGTTINSSTFPTAIGDGITGSWSPAPDSTVTTTYTFTADTGCTSTTTSMTVMVNDQSTLPIFGDSKYVPSSICVGSSFTFPTTSSNSITGTWSPPAFNNVPNTSYIFTPTNPQCGAPITNTITITPKATPIFTPVAPICSGSYSNSFTRTSTNGIYGNWSPDPLQAITSTTIYNFTPDNNECSVPTTMTVIVNPPGTPIFNNIAIINDGFGSILSQLPTTSDSGSGNGIVGTWSESAISFDGTSTYTFTPNASQCATTYGISSMTSGAQLVAKDISLRPNFSSVFLNATLNCQSVSASTVDVTTDLPENTGTFFTIDINGIIKPISLPLTSQYIPEGNYPLFFTISVKDHPEINATAKATVAVSYHLEEKKSNQSNQTADTKPSDDIAVFPNPSNGIFNIDLSTAKEDYDTVQVYNMLGAMVYEGNLKSKSSNEINLTDVATGFYIAKVSGTSGSSAFQLIKQ